MVELLHCDGGLAAGIPISGRECGKIRRMSLEALGEEVRRRRDQLRLTQEEIAERGGLSVGTIRKIETGRAGQLHPRTRHGLERALKWETGSVDAVLEGRPPSASEDDAEAAGADTTLFASHERFVETYRTWIRLRADVASPEREAFDETIAQTSRGMEEVLIRMLPKLGEADRSAAIRILAQLEKLRNP
jgi:transcriptional regulator with XRE-family HTH domain